MKMKFDVNEDNPAGRLFGYDLAALSTLTRSCGAYYAGIKGLKIAFVRALVLTSI